MSGENLPLVGRLLGHRRHRTTAGYAHLADRHMAEAAERVGRLIAGSIGLDQTSPSTHLGAMCPIPSLKPATVPRPRVPDAKRV